LEDETVTAIVRVVQNFGASIGAVVIPTAPVASVHSSSVPAGAVVLGSDGNIKPTAASDQQLCNVPVHIAPDNSVSFFFNGAWRRGDGSIAN
jgi:hypothetical protein